MKKYNFPNLKILKEKYTAKLDCVDTVDIQQIILFEKMLNIGYINFGDDVISIAENDIVNYWNEYKTTFLKKIDILAYYKLLDLPDFFDKRKPYIKTNNSFYSVDFSMSVVWPTSVNTYGSIEPLAYKRDGLVLYDFNDKLLGSIYPEYAKLYYIVETATEKWSDFSVAEKKDFAKQIVELSKDREFYLPNVFIEVLK